MLILGMLIAYGISHYGARPDVIVSCGILIMTVAFVVVIADGAVVHLEDTVKTTNRISFSIRK